MPPCSMPGKVAAAAEENKIEKYQNLPPGHFFVPITIETLGAFGQRLLALLKELGNRIRGETADAKSTEYLIQHLSVAVQRGNCMAVLGSIGY